MNTRRSAQGYVEPEITDARIARQWAGTQERIGEMARARWRWPAGTVAAVLCAAVLVLLVRGHAAPAIAKGAVVESAGRQAITLNDGSRVDLAPDSRLHIGAVESARIELELERGSAVFDVRHLAARRFVVRVGSFEIVDEGTRFDVAIADDGRIAVSVARGKVRIDRRDSTEPARFLSAGETWTTGPTAALLVVDAGLLPPPEPAPVNANPGAPDAAVPAATASAARPSASSAKELLETAQRAQREGRLRDAALAYDRLRREYRSDARAGLAAFELGRLRLGPLSDARGAVQAFQDAIVLSPKAPFREDAEAHLVEAFDIAGDAGRCQAARTAYLARYPSGLHAAGVSSRCARTQ